MSRKYTVRINYTVVAELAVRATSPVAALKLAKRIFADESTVDQFLTTERSLHALETTVGSRQHYLFPGMRKTTSESASHA
jgi:hypothetical protein